MLIRRDLGQGPSWLLPAALAMFCSAEATAQVPARPPQAPTLNYAPPQQPAARAPYQLGVTTRQVNLNEYQVGAQNVAAPPLAPTSPAPPLSGSGTGRGPGADQFDRFSVGSPAPPLSGSGTGRAPVSNRYEGVTTGSPAPPLSGSGTGREDMNLGQPLPPLSPSQSGRGTPRSVGPVPAPLPPSSPAPVPSALVRRDTPPSLGPSSAGPTPPAPAPTPRGLGGDKAGSGDATPSPSPSPTPAVTPVTPPAVNPPQASPRPMPMPMPNGFDDSPLPPPKLALEITTVVPGSVAQRMGLEPGDLILQANRYRLETHEQLKWVIANSGGRLRLKIINGRDGQEMFVDGTL